MAKLFQVLPALIAAAVLSSAVHANEQWEFSVSPYVWMAGFEGEVASIPGLPPSQVDISASDAADDTESSFMMILDAKKGKRGIYTDIFYSDSDSEENIIPGGGLSIQSITKTTMISVAYEHEIFNENNTVVDLLAGARWWHIDSTMKLRSAIPALNVSDDHTESWFDPAIGLKGRTALGNSKFFLNGGLAYGGFGINAKSFYEMSVNVGYQWTDTIGTAVGYRQYELDYDENDFKYDIKQAGWQLGFTWNF